MFVIGFPSNSALLPSLMCISYSLIELQLLGRTPRSPDAVVSCKQALDFKSRGVLLCAKTVFVFHYFTKVNFGIFPALICATELSAENIKGNIKDSALVRC